MASVIPNSLKGRLLGATDKIATAIDLVSDDLKLMLLTSSYTPDIDTDIFIDDVSANEVGDSGSYSAGGVDLTESASTDNTDDEGVFDAADVVITTATITARYGVIYKNTGTPGTSPIVAIIDFGVDKTSTAGTFTITFASEGIINLS